METFNTILEVPKTGGIQRALNAFEVSRKRPLTYSFVKMNKRKGPFIMYTSSYMQVSVVQQNYTGIAQNIVYKLEHYSTLRNIVVAACCTTPFGQPRVCKSCNKQLATAE